MNDILNALNNTMRIAKKSEDMKRHISGFVRINRGSYITGLEDLPSTIRFLTEYSSRFTEIPHSEVNAECPGAARGVARYFKAELPAGYEAMEAVVLVADLMKMGRLDELRVREGSHGPEFYIPGEPAGLGEKKTDVVWMILGPSDDGEVVWTWYPGRMTAGTALNNHAVKINA
jgi:hypothetical protein|tara:strand:+ start:271 stop:792 length:522 start_codon:yes stop_codon:yes gene_type:complete